MLNYQRVSLQDIRQRLAASRVPSGTWMLAEDVVRTTFLFFGGIAWAKNWAAKKTTDATSKVTKSMSIEPDIFSLDLAYLCMFTHF